MFEFIKLKILHEDMKSRGEDRDTFPFSFNKKSFSCIFLTDILPYRLYITTLGAEPYVLEIEMDMQYRANTFIEGYKELVAYLELKYDPNHKFKPVDFFEILNRSIPEKFSEKPNYGNILKVASKKRKIEEASKIYFCGWKRNTDGKNVRLPNLEKTRSAFGDKMAEISLMKNISSCWSDCESEEALEELSKLLEK